MIKIIQFIELSSSFLHVFKICFGVYKIILNSNSM